MTEKEFNIGDKVTAFYKTGKYYGEITGVSPSAYLIRVLAVAKHPMQGDLHNPKQTEVSMFHQRRALSFREQMNVPKNMVKPFNEEIPEYETSLKDALDNMKQKLSEEDTPWNQKSLEMVNGLEMDYFRK